MIRDKLPRKAKRVRAKIMWRLLKILKTNKIIIMLKKRIKLQVK